MQNEEGWMPTTKDHKSWQDKRKNSGKKGTGVGNEVCNQTMKAIGKKRKRASNGVAKGS
jgi:hypothetical protein